MLKTGKYCISRLNSNLRLFFFCYYWEKPDSKIVDFVLFVKNIITRDIFLNMHYWSTLFFA